MKKIFAHVVKVAISSMQSLTQEKKFSPGESFYIYGMYMYM